jgi:hypothetical protein
MKEGPAILTSENCSSIVWDEVRGIRKAFSKDLPTTAPLPLGCTIELHPERHKLAVKDKDLEAGLTYWKITFANGQTDSILGPKDGILDSVPIVWSNIFISESGSVLLRAQYVDGLELRRMLVMESEIMPVLIGQLSKPIAPFFTPEAVALLSTTDSEVVSQMRDLWGFQDEVIKFRRALVDALPIIEP